MLYFLFLQAKGLYTILAQFWANSPQNALASAPRLPLVHLTSQEKEYYWSLTSDTRDQNQKTFQIASMNKLTSMKEKEKKGKFSSVHFSSVAQSCPTLPDPMNRSMPGLPVHHHLPEFTHDHRVSDVIQPSHPLSSPSPPAPNLSQHQSLFQWVNSLHEVGKVLEFGL